MWTLRTQDAGGIGTLHTDKAQTVGAHARAEHTISAGLWYDLQLGFDRVLYFLHARYYQPIASCFGLITIDGSDWSICGLLDDRLVYSGF